MICKNGNNEIKTLSHSTYRCQYHIVFAPKYRRKAIYGKNKKDIGEIIQNQLEEDFANDQISLREYVDPFTGNKNK